MSVFRIMVLKPRIHSALVAIKELVRMGDSDIDI